MTRNEYLSELRRLLAGIPEEDRKEILYDYEEHFTIGMQNGKTEEEIAASLGDVRVIARQFRMDLSIKQAEANTSTGNVFRAVLAAVGMGFFNIVFVLGPYLGLLGVLVGLLAAAAGMVAGGIAALLALLLAPAFPSFIDIDMNGLFVGASSIGVTCLGLLFFIGDVYLAKWFFKATVRYLRWNAEIIKK